AAAGDELSQPPRVRAPELGTDRENRLRFRGEIQGLLRLVVVDPVHAVPVVEERQRSAGPVREEAMKSSVQSRRKRGVFFVQVNQIGRSRRVEPMPPL